MTPNEYQQRAARTPLDAPNFELTDEEVMILWNAIGLAGEAGEVAEIIKKAILHRHGLDTDTRLAIFKELGDVCWYVSAICTKMGFRLEGVMQANINKLDERYPEGFTSEASKKRVEQ